MGAANGRSLSNGRKNITRDERFPSLLQKHVSREEEAILVAVGDLLF